MDNGTVICQPGIFVLQDDPTLKSPPSYQTYRFVKKLKVNPGLGRANRVMVGSFLASGVRFIYVEYR